MPVYVMGISMLPTETVACEDETEEQSTLFTSTTDSDIGDDGFFKPLCFNFSKASFMAHS